jgi:serine/threonine-protein kinase
MSLLSCSRGHSNTSGNRFCQQCGEKLDFLKQKGSPGTIVGERYRILRQLGQGGFGHTYLVEDLNRFNERCVLKEFAPLIQSGDALQKAKELFEREAGVLYQLQHPQIPRFREWFVETSQQSLFLVQDYVEGQTYQALLKELQQQGQAFTEAEVIQFLCQVLPILDYIHRQGVIHRDISPDNLMVRQADNLPVLIDFGGVKQVTAVLESRFAQAFVKAKPNAVTLLGKPGYAPDEQMRFGKVFPHSDLYALAVTALVLLIGKEPQAFFDPKTSTFCWHQEVTLNPALAAVLEQMLAANPSDRYASALEVLEALSNCFPRQSNSAQNTLVAKVATHTTAFFRTVVVQAQWGLKKLIQMLVLLLTIAALGSLGWLAARLWLQAQRPAANADVAEAPMNRYSTEEQTRKAMLFDRRENLRIDEGFFNRLVNQAYYAQYPEQQGRLLTNNPKDADLRANWDKVAMKLLAAISKLSPEARDRLESYTRADLSAWESQLRHANLNRQAFYDAVDTKFFQLLPMYRGQDFQGSLANQIWYALAADYLKSLLMTQKRASLKG